MATSHLSLIIPVYNRPNEVEDLLDSLTRQSETNFEVVIVEDGSKETCQHVIEAFKNKLDVSYFYIPNGGPGNARNYGAKQSKGDYLIVLDSDCILPPGYIQSVNKELKETGADAFGGPDKASDSFTDVQKAINYSMTSFLTTGGIRGGKIQLEKFVPRTYNMGFSRRVYEAVGGFREMFSEDIDMSTRIRQAGFSPVLLRQVYVWHKRRVDFRRFFRQVYVFGMSRVTLKLLYPGSLKLVHLFPACFVIGTLALILLGIFVSPWFLLPLGIYLAAVFIGALVATKSLKIGALAVPAAVIQLGGYGLGFIKAYTTKIILGRGRDISEEVFIRQGKNEKL